MLDMMAVHCRPMPFREYLALPRGVRRAEYVNGWAVVGPPPSVRRQRACQRLSRLLQGSIVSPAQVVRRTGWQIRTGCWSVSRISWSWPGRLKGVWSRARHWSSWRCWTVLRESTWS